MTHTLSVVAFLSALTAAACGKVVPVDTDGGVGSDDASLFDAAPVNVCLADTIAFDDLLPCVLEAQCGYFVRCEFSSFTVEECVVLFGNEIGTTFEHIEDAIAQGTVSYDATAAAACAEGFSTASCDAYNEGGDCEAVFVGTIADGTSCYLDEECSGIDADCDGGGNPDQCSVGSCVDQAAIGEDCRFRSCASGDHCVDNGNERQCESGALNSECSDDYDCDSGLYCPAGTCQEGLAINLACTQDSQCLDPMRCVADQCAFVDTVGSPCEYSCDNNLICEGFAPPTLGTCAEKHDVGGTCEYNSHCVAGLFCRDSDSICQTRPVLGQACMPNDCAQGLYCTNELPGSPQDPPPGTCVEPSANGQPCDRDRHCTSGICNGSDLCEGFMSCY